ncbi:MAG: hypothetical protein AAF901_09155, partial [Bacteroidota bacterium]
TFLVEGIDDENVTENLVVTLQPDGTYSTAIVAYEFINDEQVQINSAPLDGFDSSQYIDRSSFSFTCTTTVTYEMWMNEGCSCIYIHILSSETSCSYSYYETISAGESGGSGGIGLGTADGWGVWTGGGGGDGTNIISSPALPCKSNGGTSIIGSDGCSYEDDAECQKLKTIMNKPIGDGGKIQQVVQALDPYTSENYEVSLSIDNQNSIHAEQGTQGTSGVTFNTNPIHPYTVVAHTHDAYGLDGNGTLSVFSFDDLKYLAETIFNDKIDGTFVAILITNKGTRYAMTINDTSKFLDLFYYKVVDFPSTPEEYGKYGTSRNELKPLLDEYYDLENPNRKIKATETNNETTLRHFLKFLEEGGAGVSLYEANADFSNFQPVTLDVMGFVKRNEVPCNIFNQN